MAARADDPADDARGDGARAEDTRADDARAGDSGADDSGANGALADGALTAAIGALLRRRAGPFPRTIGVAVSGGGDSTTLLLAADIWAREAGVGLRAATVDHGLRAEAAAEARHVAALCARHDIPHDTLALAELKDGADLQARARAARYGALAAWGRETGVPAVLLGHTADDVAETLLMRLARGAGVDGLAAMAEWRRVGGVDFGRPFLRLTRAALRDILARRGVVPIEDPTNDARRFERVRVRQAMVSLALDPAMLARSAAHLALARASLVHRMATLGETLFHEDRGDLLLLRRDIATLRAEAPDLLRRLLVGALGWIGGAMPPRVGEQARLLDAAAELARPMTLAGCLIAPLGGPLPGLRLAREAAACAPPVALRDGGTSWDGRWLIEGPVVSGLTVGALGGDIRLTPWRATGLPHASLRASPAIRDAAGSLLSAPVADLAGAHHARLSPQFSASLRQRSGVFD